MKINACRLIHKNILSVSGLLICLLAVGGGLFYVLHPDYPEWTHVCGASFRMGSPEGAEDEQPCHTQVLSFAISQCEITVSEFATFLNKTGGTPVLSDQFICVLGHYWAKPWLWYKPVCVSYAEAEAYAYFLSQIVGHSVRLPTESEWEFAARGGIHGARYPWGWGDDWRGRACFNAEKTRKVGSYPSNPYGLYDMAGNVFEWCMDEVGTNENAYARGGSWAEKDPGFLTVFSRTSFSKTYADQDVGFRIVCNLSIDVDN